MQSNCEVVIVGGSVAGASLALSLSLRGVRVVLIDKGVFPRSKACGEGLSWRGVKVLQRLGLTNRLDRAQLREFDGYNIWGDSRDPIIITTPQAGCGIERIVLDNMLVQQAAQGADVTSIFGCVVDRFDVAGGAVKVGSDLIKGTFLVDAAGGVSIGEGNRGCDSKRIGMTYHVTCADGPMLHQVHIFLGDIGELFCTPLSANRMNVSFLGYGRLHGRSITDSQIRIRIETALRRLSWHRPSISGPIGASLRLARRNATEGKCVLRVGDACEQFDPIGGMGMTHALLSSELAAGQIVSALAGKISVAEALERYSREREEIARPMRAFTSITLHGLKPLRKFSGLAGKVVGHVGGRLSEIVHHPESAKCWEREILSAIGGVM